MNLLVTQLIIHTYINLYIYLSIFSIQSIKSNQ